MNQYIQKRNATFISLHTEIVWVQSNFLDFQPHEMQKDLGCCDVLYGIFLSFIFHIFNGAAVVVITDDSCLLVCLHVPAQILLSVAVSRQWVKPMHKLVCMKFIWQRITLNGFPVRIVTVFGDAVSCVASEPIDSNDHVSKYDSSLLTKRNKNSARYLQKFFIRIVFTAPDHTSR